MSLDGGDYLLAFTDPVSLCKQVTTVCSFTLNGLVGCTVFLFSALRYSRTKSQAN